MKITDYHEKDGDIEFLVDTEKLHAIHQHLRSKRLNAGAIPSDTDFSKITVGNITPEQLNQALEDFPD
jgi:hypothetical protein